MAEVLQVRIGRRAVDPKGVSGIRREAVNLNMPVKHRRLLNRDHLRGSGIAWSVEKQKFHFGRVLREQREVHASGIYGRA